MHARTCRGGGGDVHICAYEREKWRGDQRERSGYVRWSLTELECFACGGRSMSLCEGLRRCMEVYRVLWSSGEFIGEWGEEVGWGGISCLLRDYWKGLRVWCCEEWKGVEDCDGLMICRSFL